MARTQTTVRFNEVLLQKFRITLEKRSEVMNDVLNEAVKKYIADSPELPSPSRVETNAHLDHVAEILAEEVTKQLRTSTEWAAAVIQSAQLGLPQEGFGERIKHYHVEKDFLAFEFLQQLWPRIRLRLSQGKKCVLVIDSGTTLYWVFRQLSKLLLAELNKRTVTAEQLGHLSIITNNLIGIESFMIASRLNDLSADATKRSLCDLVKCRLLPGEILPVYGAVTGEDTEHAMRLHRRLARPDTTDTKFIGLITGNWVMLSDGVKPYPIPLARGARHREFKEAVIQACDEIYVLAPLGKLIIDCSLPDLNRILGYDFTSSDPIKAGYKDVRFESQRRVRGGQLTSKTQVTRLVSTLRRSDQLLSNHSTKLSTLLRLPDMQSHSEPSRDFSHMLFPFQRYANNSLRDQWFIEFPHAHTREISGFSALFGVAFNLIASNAPEPKYTDRASVV